MSITATIARPTVKDGDDLNGAFYSAVLVTGVEVPTGNTPGTACDGADTRLPTQGENDALVGTNGTPSASNAYVTSTDPRLPTQTENDALAGTAGTPSSSNAFVTNTDPRLSDSRKCNGTFDSPAAARTGIGLDNSPSGRANLGLGGSATLEVGTTAGTVAAGNDSRFPSSAEKSALTGTSGTPSGGNRFVTETDSRLTNSRPCNNSFDSPTAARTALGLGNSATANIGSTAGSVCGGDDGRLSNSRRCNNTFDNPASARSALGLAAVASSGSYSDLNNKPKAVWGSLIKSMAGNTSFEDYYFDITAYGFSSRPSSGQVTISSDLTYLGAYSWDDSTATRATFRFRKISGNTGPGDNVRFSFWLGE